MKEPLPKGCVGEGKKAEDYFDLMLDEYYMYKGWDPKTGLQTRAKLEELGLADVADVLEKEGALSRAKPKPRDAVLKEASSKAENFKKQT